MIALLFIFAALDVRHVTRVESRSWQPLGPTEVERLLEQETLTLLGKLGQLKLQRSTFAELKQGEYALLIEGRFIEDTGNFSVYLTFAPGQKSDVPSYYVLETTAVEDHSPAEIQALITRVASKAADRLGRLLTRQGAVPGFDSPPVPIDFGPIEMPHVTHATGAVAVLIDVRKKDHDRQTAFWELEKHVFDQPLARTAIERCAVADPWATLLASCVSALTPIARTRLETQRLLLSAMRSEIAPDVLGALAAVSKSFAGLSRKEADATWLDVLSSEGTPGESARAIAELLRAEHELPNLDLALSRCLAQQTLVEAKKHACAQLLPKLPAARRISAVYRYLEKAESSAPDNVMREIDAFVWGNGSEPLDPLLADLLLRIAPEPRMRDMLFPVLRALRRYPKPTAQTIAEVLRIADVTLLAADAFDTVSAMVGTAPELRAGTLVALERLRDHRFMRRHDTPEPHARLMELIKALKR